MFDLRYISLHIVKSRDADWLSACLATTSKGSLVKSWRSKRAEMRQKETRRRHPLADHAREAWTVIVVVVVVACAPHLSPEALSLIGVMATLLGSRVRPQSAR